MLIGDIDLLELVSAASARRCQLLQTGGPVENQFGSVSIELCHTLRTREASMKLIEIYCRAFGTSSEKRTRLLIGGLITNLNESEHTGREEKAISNSP